ncbi:acid phosphatase/vanadium-dependent haloperoxidase-related protein [Raphidiopsis curvata NIES-932]|nr:acid phosphatase/vanadium-dependent haloperoxidase-related protein [Raphidiopsis curvata NIES-932]
MAIEILDLNLRIIVHLQSTYNQLSLNTQLLIPLPHQNTMQDIGDIFYNRVLLVALVACFVSQGLKLIFEFIKHRKLDLRVLVTTGGMPSAHSALVTALAAGVGQTIGWSSPDFALAAVVAIIVMYDATGVRQAAGKQARILNQMVDQLFHEKPEFFQDRLKELLGHTPLQVVAGSVLGAAISCLASYWLTKAPS